MTSPNPNWPILTTQVAFNAGPASNVTPVWTDISSQVQSLSTTRGRQYELDTIQAGTANMVLLDSNEAFNPANTASAYYPNVVPYRRIITQALWPPTNTAAGGPNMLTKMDPGFEAAAVGGLPAGDINWFLTSPPTVSTAQAFQGTQSVSWPVSSGGGLQGMRWKLTVTPGQQYTFSAYVWLTAAYTVQLGIDTSLVDPPASFAATGAGTSTTGAWTRITVTWTATQPRINLWVYAPSPANTGTVYVDAIQQESGATATTWSTSGPVLYSVFTGYVERWPSRWDFQGTYGMAEITCVDSLAVLSQQAVHGEVANQILSYQPAYYWPLWEPQGASSFAEASGNNGPSLGLMVSKYGAGSGVSAGQSSAITGDPGGVAAQFFPDQATSSNGTAIGAGRSANKTTGIVAVPATPGSAWGATLAAWVHCDAVGVAPNVAGDIALVGEVTGNNTTLPIGMFMQGDATIVAEVGYAVGGGASAGYVQAITTKKINDGNWHHIVSTVSQNSTNTTVTVWIDGTSAASTTVTTSSLGGMLPSNATSVMVGGENDTGRVTQMFDGEIAHVALWNSVLSSSQISTLNTAGGGFWGESSGTRVTRLANIYYTIPSFADVGSSTMGFSLAQNGNFALDVMNDVAISEQGFLFVDAGGTLRFKGRNSRFLATTSQWTFGELEVPYLDDINYSLDPTQVYNDVEVTRSGGIVQHVTDPTSILANFDRQLTQTIGIAYDSETIDHANYLLWRYKTPVERLGALTIDAGSNPYGAFATVLGMELNQRITVKRRNPVFTMSHDFFLEKLDHSIDFSAGQWTVGIQASPVDRQQVWIVGDPVFGQLDVSAVCAF
jgi:hypothetical protein